MAALICAPTATIAYLYIPDRIEEGYGPNAPALLALGASAAQS